NRPVRLPGDRRLRQPDPTSRSRAPPRHRRQPRLPHPAFPAIVVRVNVFLLARGLSCPQARWLPNMFAARSTGVFSRNDHSLGRLATALLPALLFLVSCSPRPSQNLFQGTACQEAVTKISGKAKGRNR